MRTSSSTATATGTSTMLPPAPPTDSPSQSQAPAQSISVSAIPPVTEMASLPRELTDYFAGRSMRLCLASVLPMEVRRRAKVAALQLRIQDVPEADQERVLDWIAAGGFRRVGDHFLLGDTCIYKQPIATFEALGWRAYEDWASQQPNPEREAAEMSDIARGEASDVREVRSFQRVYGEAERESKVIVSRG